MKKLALAALAALALAAVALLPRVFETVCAGRRAGRQAGRRRRAAAGVPVTAGTVAAADVPVLLNAIGTVQAYNMVTVKSRVDGQIVASISPRARTSRPARRCSRSTRGRTRRRSTQAEATKQKDEAQLASAQPDLARWAELVGAGLPSRARPTTRPRRRSQQLQAAIKGDEAQINDGPAQPRLCRRSARRSTAGSAPGWSMPATWCAPPMPPGSSRSRSSKPIYVSLHAAAGEPAQGAREAGAGAARGAGLSARTARRRSPTAS